MMNDAQIIVGRVRHRRLSPAAHAFVVPAFMLRLPMSRPDGIPSIARSWWMAFDERDHGLRDGSSPVQWVRDQLAARSIDAGGDIELVAFPRMLGYAFKPVSFWICRDAAGGVRAVVVEVHNTFGETHAYLLANADRRPLETGQTLHAGKAFHVSPFLQVKGAYRFRFDFGPDRFAAHIDYDEDEQTVLETSMAGRARPLTRAALIATAIRFPIQSIATTVRIHWHAVRLWSKRVPWFPHRDAATAPNAATARPPAAVDSLQVTR